MNRENYFLKFWTCRSAMSIGPYQLVIDSDTGTLAGLPGRTLVISWKGSHMSHMLQT